METCLATFEFDPVLVTIPVPWTDGFPIRWYALAYIAGLMLGWRYLTYLSRRPTFWSADGSRTKPKSPFTEEQIDDLLVWATLGVIGGGRLGYVVFYGWQYMATGVPYEGALVADPLLDRLLWTVTGITDGGMSFHGGLIGVAIAIYFVSRAAKLDLLRVGDAVAMVAPLGLFFGRIANFINGELWGRPTDVPWAMTFASDRLCLPRHPSQLYEAALEGFALFAIINVMAWKFKALSRPGLCIGLFLFFYGIFRSLMETVREPDLHLPDFLRGTITTGMILSIPMIIIGGYLVYRAIKANPYKSTDGEKKASPDA
jgi:phosphatidylglycerol:prolipoprotein diacylglycerol transferase